MAKIFEVVRKRAKAWAATGIGGVAAVAVAGLLGAFDKVEESLPMLDTGHAIEAGQWGLTSFRSYIADQPRPFGLLMPSGARALVVEVELSNLTSRSSKDYFGTLKLASSTIPADVAPFVVLARDETLSPALHPGLPERMVYIWPLPRQVEAPSNIVVIISRKTYKAQDNLYGLPGWFSPRPMGQLSIGLANMDSGRENRS